MYTSAVLIACLALTGFTAAADLPDLSALLANLPTLPPMPQSCTEACDLTCANPTCIDIPNFIDCAAITAGCANSCKAECACYADCVSSCSADRASCEAKVAEIAPGIDSTYAAVACDGNQYICGGICTSACPLKLFTQMINNFY